MSPPLRVPTSPRLLDECYDMSKLTMTLLNRKPPRNALRWRVVLEQVADELVLKYGIPSLGNYRDPVKEIFYIVLSTKTSENLYKTVNKELWKRFGDLTGIAKAPIDELHDCVAKAGLGDKRTKQLREIARRLLCDFGKRPGNRLRRLSETAVYEYLIALPGVGPKSALCVMMYSLDKDVFPVDAHVHRVMRRIGAINDGRKHYVAQARLPSLVPNGRSKELHVTLLIHGRQVCRPRSPHCNECCIAHLCRTGIKKLRLKS